MYLPFSFSNSSLVSKSTANFGRAVSYTCEIEPWTGSFVHN